MTDESSQPRWDLLPHRPREFFGLGPGFGRTDLRRCYSQWIRRFKPDKFPDEFQRIRSAYEFLDQQINYHSGMAGETTLIHSGFDGPETTEPLSFSESPAREIWGRFHSTEEEGIRNDERTLLERIENQSAEAVYQQIAAQSLKRPIDYFALAILSDVVCPEDEGRFGKWLLSGLQEFQDEFRLYDLLHAYFNIPIPPNAIATLLLMASETFKNDRFYAITTPLWQQLLESMDFKTFRELLERCESNVHDFRANSKITFYIDLLINGIWKADLDWIESTIAFVEENHESVPPHLSFDADLLGIMRQYAIHRPSFLNGNPFRESMDHALRKHYSHRDGESLAMWTCQLQISNDPDSLLQAFPLLDDSKQRQENESFHLLWNVASQTLLNRDWNTPNPSPDLNFWQPLTKRLLARFEHYQWFSWPGFRMQWIDLFCRFGSMLLYIVLPLLVAFLAMTPVQVANYYEGPWILLSATIGLGLGLKFAYQLSRRFVKPFHVRTLYSSQQQIVDKFWRRDLVLFMTQTQLDYRTIAHLMSTCELKSLPNGLQAIQQFSTDEALAILSTSLRFK